MDERAILENTEEKMGKVIESFKKDLSTVRAGRATPALLDRVTVDYYGVPTPVSQTATVGVNLPRTLVIQPWDKTMIAAIEKAIQKADLGAMPVSDGNALRLTIPALSGERRQEILKNVNKMSELQKVAVRNIRRDVIQEIKKDEKDKLISEDESRKIQDKIQKLTDKYISAVEEVAAIKEQEIMEV